MPEERHIWELRLNGRPWVRTDAPYCGYEPPELRSMLAVGYKLYCDGKPVPADELPE